MIDELAYIEREAREQGEADCLKQLSAEALALFRRLNELYWGASKGQRTRLGWAKYRAWLRWRRRVAQEAH